MPENPRSKVPENPTEIPLNQECTLYSIQKSPRNNQNSSIVKIDNYRRSSPCHSSPNFKDNEELTGQDHHTRMTMSKGGFKIQEFERPESTRMTEPDMIELPENSEVVPKPMDFASQ